MACLRSGSERGGGCRLLGWAPSIHCNTFCRGPTILTTSLDSFRNTLSSGDGVIRFLSLCHNLRLQGPHSGLGPRPLLPGTPGSQPLPSKALSTTRSALHVSYLLASAQPEEAALLPQFYRCVDGGPEG